MKKAIKVLLILVVIVSSVTGGLYYYYNYKQSKKVAQVVSLQNLAMTDFWGDSIQSYGQVAADKAQTGYITSGTEILSINVSEGDHVNAGDVIFTVQKESQDIRGKELEVQKAEQAYIADKNRLERLQNTKPIPEYIATGADTREKTISVRTYFLKDGCSIEGYSYGSDDPVYTVTSGVTSKDETEYFAPGGRYLDTDREEDKKKIEDLKEKIAKAKESAGDDIFRESLQEDTTEVTVGTWYFDAETGNVIGHEKYGDDGELVERYTPPEGYKPSELKKEIETVENSLKKTDLELRVKQSQLEQMRNTNENGEVYAKISGTVSKIQSKDNYNANQPFFIITATDDYYISGTIGEFYLNQVNIGDSVSISSWETGNTAEAVITSISDNPSKEADSWSGGNSNSSNYEFKASFDKNAGIEIGAPVDISITPQMEEESSVLFIPSYFVRKDASGSYVMKMNKAGVLEKVTVHVGRNLWGYMTEIKSGISIDDLLAFPYGNGAIEGIKCEPTDSLDGLYDGGLG